ncbi:hypothetical protein HXX76_001799 [Chlamydomonas incerta]|uniref:DUF1538 domain-containing protein n=1 Tax=Chlamydomonas incerta TaxID=51695 RepID=A0A835WA07_CHLIN|nr:hypothetical protein HXX76_001799 [Chlamydomonas incerta]|eukprot:KAG2443441.1 hypothetical protein HXX76_001799 [Chlamydomonas incerta]
MSDDGVGVRKRGCMARCDAAADRAHMYTDYKLERWGLVYRQRLLVFHMLDQLKEQIMAILPISFLLIFVIGVFFQQPTNAPGETAFGLVCAIFGLLFFMEGLRVCIMPLGEMVGRRLPMKYPLWVVLMVAGGLGILVTYAEPAISSLTPLAKLVDKTKAPYLYYALNDQREMLVLSIGLGVGLAAVIGTLRFVKGWPLKPIIYASLLPTIGMACYMQWGNPDLAPLLGLAWDCGGVTTGPVTVPILLAMGIGVMGSQRQKRLAKAALQNAVDTNTGQTLEGFGVVTLASVYPIMAVELMGIFISLTKTTEEIIQSTEDTNTTAAVDQSPVREVLFAIRAIMPLVTALLLLVVVVIREPIPHLTPYTVGPHVSGPDDSAHGSVTSGGSGADYSNQDSRRNKNLKALSVGPPPLGKESRSIAAGSTSIPLTTVTSQTAYTGTHEAGEAGAGAAGATDGAAAAAGAATGSDGGNSSGSGSSPKSKPGPGPVAEGSEEGQQAAPPGAAVVVAAADRPPTLLAHSPMPATAAPAELDAREGDGHSSSAATADAATAPPAGAAAAAGAAKSAGGMEGLENQMHVLHDKMVDAMKQAATAATAPAVSDDGARDPMAMMVTLDADGKPIHEPWWRRYGGLIVGVIMAQGGMIAFNIGLTYGFTALGDQAGTLLPAAYMAIPGEPKSPYYSFVGGIILIMAVTFSLGFMATRAEPALRVLGRTVQHLSGGAFTCAMLVYAVSVGVGIGMAVGSTKILFGVPIIYIILIKYTIAVGITAFSPEDITNIAWDSAGVTTGPVTVPFVLSLGIGFSKATGAAEGFGILTAASVAPIISVLLTNLFKNPFKKAVRSMSRSFSRMSSRRGTLSRTSLAAMSKRAKRHKDTNQAIDQMGVIAAAAARLETHSNWTLGTSPSFAPSSGMQTPGSLAAPSGDFNAAPTQQMSAAPLSPRDGTQV